VSAEHGSPPQDRPVQAHPAAGATLGVAAAGAYVALTAVVRAAGLPGASRRFTGS
jgi:hypothetical protein